MGMTADAEAAVAEGATLVRIGTAIFGPRPHRYAQRALLSSSPCRSSSSTSLQLLISVLMLLVIGRVLVSWIARPAAAALIAFIYQATEPILAPIRRVVPPTGGLDWAPLIAILLLGLLLRPLVHPARQIEGPEAAGILRGPDWAISSAG